MWALIHTSADILGGIENLPIIETKLFNEWYDALEASRDLFLKLLSEALASKDLVYCKYEENTARIYGEQTVQVIGVRKVNDVNTEAKK